MNKFSKNTSWKVLNSELLFNSKWLRVRRDACLLSNGATIDDFYVVEVPDGVTIVAITDEQELILVRQYKHGLGKMVLELPAGIVEPGETHATAVIRELQEETGYSADNIEYIITLATKPARMAARTWVYFASNVNVRAAKQNSKTEIIDTILVPIEEVMELVKNGDIITETSLAGIFSVWDKINKILKN